MPTNNVRLRQLVDLSDLFIKVASSLRQRQHGRELRHPEVVQRAIEFLDNALEGGGFLSGTKSELHAGSLRPINWVTDTMSIMTPADDEAQAPTYEEIVESLEPIKQLLITSLDHPLGDEADSAVDFFGALGDLLAAQADQQMRKTSAPRPCPSQV